jgi:hypothetical protein
MIVGTGRVECWKVRTYEYASKRVRNGTLVKDKVGPECMEKIVESSESFRKGTVRCVEVIIDFRLATTSPLTTNFMTWLITRQDSYSVTMRQR